jgi:pyrroloquinoline-quinone synthase
MNRSDVLHRLDELIHSRSILGHPFYQAWQRGELTREQLATYARVYYPHVAAFPSYLEAAIERASDPVIRAELARNLADELQEPQAHMELWLDFAEELGLDRMAVASQAPYAATTAVIGTFRRLTNEVTAHAVAALYAYESQQPEVSSQKMEGLRQHYGVETRKALAYFDVHATMDTGHRQGERDALARCLDAGASGDNLLQAASDGLDAYWALLDGVCAEAGIATAC